MFRSVSQAAQLIYDLKRALVAARAVHATDTNQEYSEETDPDGLLDRAKQGATWLEQPVVWWDDAPGPELKIAASYIGDLVPLCVRVAEYDNDEPDADHPKRLDLSVVCWHTNTKQIVELDPIGGGEIGRAETIDAAFTFCVKEFGVEGSGLAWLHPNRRPQPYLWVGEVPENQP